MKNKSFISLSLFSIILLFAMQSCNWPETKQQTSDSGVTKATVKVEVNSEGHTAEQSNIIQKNVRDNQVGSIKYLYQISAYTGKVMYSSTVKGKVTSGGKRLSPSTVRSYEGLGAAGTEAAYVNINGTTHLTDELPDEYGTYGSSMPYLYWFDANDSYQQLYISGGTSVHISDHPIRIREQVLQLEVQNE